jgi:hypothetical protein
MFKVDIKFFILYEIMFRIYVVLKKKYGLS